MGALDRALEAHSQPRVWGGHFQTDLPTDPVRGRLVGREYEPLPGDGRHTERERVRLGFPWGWPDQIRPHAARGQPAGLARGTDPLDRV